MSGFFAAVSISTVPQAIEALLRIDDEFSVFVNVNDFLLLLLLLLLFKRDSVCNDYLISLKCLINHQKTNPYIFIDNIY